MKMCGLLSKNQVNSTIKSTRMFSLFSVVSLTTRYSVFSVCDFAVREKVKILYY